MGFLTGSPKKRGWSDEEQAAEDDKQRGNAAANGVPQGPPGTVTRREVDTTQFGGGAHDVLYDEAHPGGVGVGPSSGEKEVNRYRSLGEEAAKREAYKVDFSLAQADRANSLKARGQQLDAADMQRNAAMGNAPSRAAIMGNQVAGQSLDATLGASAGAKGLGAAAMQTQAMRGQGAMQLGAQGQAMGMRSQEMNAARMSYMGGLNGIRGGDYTSMATAQEQAEAQAKAEMAQRQLNQVGQMGYEQMGVNVKQAELDASIRNAVAANSKNANETAVSDAKKARNERLGIGLVTTVATGGTKSDIRSKQGIRKLSFSDAQAKREAYLLGRKEAGGSGKEAMARAWDEGHSTAVANVEKVSRMTPAELKAHSEKSPEAAAVLGIKGRSWDEGNKTAGKAVLAAHSAEKVNATQSAMDAAIAEQRAQKAAYAKENGDEAPMAPAPGAPAASPSSWSQLVSRVGGALSDENTKQAKGGADDMGKALADMKPYEYEYKPEYGGDEGQQPGEKNVGPMAQDMAKNPITGSAVIKRPDGMLAVDMTKAGKLSLGAIGYLAAKQREQSDEIARLKKGQR